MTVSILALGLMPVLAGAPPTGSYTNTFTGQAVWDISGTYGDESGFDGSYTISQDAQGKLTGSGTAYFYDYSTGIEMDLDITVNGSVKGANGITTVVLIEKLSGSTYYYDYNTDRDYPVKVNATVALRATVDQVNQTLSGAITGKACASVGGQSACVSLTEANGGEPITFDGPIADADMDGSWDLIADVQNVDGMNLIANATVQLSNGRTFDLGGKGKYVSAVDQSKIALKGNSLSPSKGVSLKLIANGATLEIVGMTGKLLGQKQAMTGP
jgi:hypothetical protein